LTRSALIAWFLRIATAAMFGIDAGVHAYNAAAYDQVSGTISEGNLFRVEAAVACLVALGVLLWPSRLTWIVAVVVAASALGAVLLYRYVDVGALGPLPNMYENTWDVPGKVLSAWAEGAALVLAALGLLHHELRSRAR
jgi:hypothetical protein